jgi:hypothetical protein
VNAHRLTRWLAIGSWLICLIICGWSEYDRLLQAAATPGGVLTWFTDWNAETTLCGAVLLCLPVLLATGSRDRGRRGGKSVGTDASATHSSRWNAAVVLLLAGVAFLASMSVGLREIEFRGPQSIRTVAFAELPPAYHDEYSYLLQARTFRAGRWSWPPPPAQAELFHQFHVLNEPVVASRYFPWTGLWVAAFVQLPWPIVGHWFAHAVATAFFSLCLLRHLPVRWFLFAGGLIAVSPGIVVFSNLLLSHQPTLMALSIFLWAFDGLMLRGGRGFAVTAGVALAVAMLGRPMTAAGFALPFGCWLTVRVICDRRHRQGDLQQPASRSHRGSLAITLGTLGLVGVPLLAGVCVIGWQNHSITGSWTKTPYQVYTARYTPRHRYGFNNADGVPEAEGPAAVRAYDRWASNLTPGKALSNIGRRLLASLQWSLAVVPLLLGLLMSIAATGRSPDGRFVVLVGCSVLSLHAVHLPYWYDGIMHWHYVFETGPLLIVLAVFGWRSFCSELAIRMTQRRSMLWIAVLVCVGLMPGWLDVSWAWGDSKISQAVSEQAFSRVRFAYFNELLRDNRLQSPALILVNEQGADPQLSYIINPPDLQGPALVCRYPDLPEQLSSLRTTFSDRAFYLFDPSSLTLRPLPDQSSDESLSAP